MLSRVVLLVLAVTVVVADEHGDHPQIKCGDITPLKTVPYTQLAGNWVGVETLRFKDGHPYVPENDDTSNTCMYAKATEASDHGMKLTLEITVPDHELSTKAFTLTTTGENEGRLSVASEQADLSNWEFLVLAEQPDKYLVYMACQPPNEAGDRLPARVNLFSRHADHSDHEVITQDEELQIERRIGEMLHLSSTENKPVRFSHSCWASYAEPSN